MCMFDDRTEWAGKLFQSIDAKDTDTFLTYLTDDVTFRFGNADAVHGKGSVGEAVNGFFQSIKGLKHDIAMTWTQENAVICHGTVTYTRMDDSTLAVPFANILGTNGDLIREYLIFIDISELYKESFE